VSTRIKITYLNSKEKERYCLNIPIESIRKTRLLNIDVGSCRVSGEVYKILKSNNGRKIFTPYHGAT